MTVDPRLPIQAGLCSRLYSIAGLQLIIYKSKATGERVWGGGGGGGVCALQISSLPMNTLVSREQSTSIKDLVISLYLTHNTLRHN